MSSLVWFFAGAVLAAAYCAALAHNTRRYLTGGAVTWAIALHAGRLLVLISAFVGIAFFGRGALLPATAGFVLAHATGCAVIRNRT
jgi:hypothetical protein